MNDFGTLDLNCAARGEARSESSKSRERLPARGDPRGTSEAPCAGYADVLGEELDGRGWAVLPSLIRAADCAAIGSLYSDDANFRSTITMSRHGFGSGEYRYFSYPLPPFVSFLRAALYAPLAKVANRWAAALGQRADFPAQLDDYLDRCLEAGQARPTPLLLHYRSGDFNCLHQDVYGELIFPFQAAILLSEPAVDFGGGEFVLVEQKPRAQSRAHVIPLRQGDAVIFPVRHRAVQGSRGWYRSAMRHGVSALTGGERFTLGLIFHDAR